MATPTTTLFPSTTSTAVPSCITITPGKYGYVPPEACNAQWAYAPSFSAAVTFSVLFGILSIAQTVQAFIYRKGFCWVMIMAVVWELIAFVTRAMGAHNQQSQALSYVSNIFFLLAPLWLNAFAYMTAGRLIWTFHPAQAVFKVKAVSIGKYFVWLDVVSFLIQLTGGSMLSPSNDPKTMDLGKNIYMAGVGIQELFIILFTVLIVKFHVDLVHRERETPSSAHLRWKWLTYALYAALTLISIRIIFRLVEFSAGADVSNPLPYHEVYPLVFDAFPMVTAITILTAIHPGIALKGPQSEFPSRKQKRAEKKAKKAKKVALRGEVALSRGYITDASYQPIIRHDVELGVRG